MSEPKPIAAVLASSPLAAGRPPRVVHAPVSLAESPETRGEYRESAVPASGEGAMSPPSSSPEPSPVQQESAVSRTSHSGPTPEADSAPAAAPVVRWGEYPGWLGEYERMARTVANAITLPDAIRRLPTAADQARSILAIALTGRELGIGFMESLRMVHIIKGTPALAAELKVKLANHSGHEIRLVSGTAQRAEVGCAVHPDAPTAEFTLEQAKRAGLLKEDSGWVKYPEDMLYARAATRFLRRHCPGSPGGSLRAVEEINGD